jgi:hypothetical protein
MNEICDNCFKEMDRFQEAGCLTHRKYYCSKCAETYICVPGEACKKYFITNREWMHNFEKLIK